MSGNRMSSEKISLWSLCRAEAMKYRRSGTGKLWLFMPAVTLAVAFWLSRSYGTISGYNWWYVGLYPGMLSLVCCMTAAKDAKLGSRAVLSLPVRPARVWDAKILTCALAAAKANILVGVLAWVLGNILLPAVGIEQTLQVSWTQTLAAVLVMTAAGIWQVPLCLWMGQRLGMLPALIINVALATSGVLTAVTSFWMADPYAVLPRLMCAVIGVLPNNMPARPGIPTSSPELLDTSAILPGLTLCLALLVFLWYLSRRWYERKGAVQA